MIKDDALAVMMNYIVSNRVAKPIQNNRKKIPSLVLLIKSQPALRGSLSECDACTHLRWQRWIVSALEAAEGLKHPAELVKNIIES